MRVLPPGTWLQLMYLGERLRRVPAGRFVEIGPGSGEITALLLQLGWQGTSFDLDPHTTARLSERFAAAVSEQRYSAVNADFLAESPPAADQRIDLVISCMVMEHMDEPAEAAYLNTARAWLKDDGLLIGLVPGSPAHWGIEDEIAGHYRRYTRTRIDEVLRANALEPRHVAGLTFPVSNLLLPLSNFLVNRSERQKVQLSKLEQTKLSGRRDVAYKTRFPPLLGLLLNPYALYPLHLVQKALAASESALVLYFEAQQGHPQAADPKHG